MEKTSDVQNGFSVFAVIEKWKAVSPISSSNKYKSQTKTLVPIKIHINKLVHRLDTRG